ncbi:GTPase ObgE [Miniphocaeibacter halophilus]|uniref:GTPase ObgE n=1 Tax=Miniphocaeibacter halophilus TaxID=2931922 RepID=A0AC61MRS4_9FIRM|nr:GTPase ObgE [Miniphocaeibacter halophilus]QQK07159.1 GTPase ObgE [Miniphocaeibacter halophilus]
MFIDVAKIELKAGKGGDGAVSFRREKYEPSGGPYGGDGGNGGSIYLVASNSIRTLMDFRYKRHYKAENGENGGTKKMYGKKGEDLYLKVPVGTLVKDFDSDRVIHDMKEDGEVFLICKGGRGGRGNAKFASSTRQAPRFAEPGTKGQERTIKLEIKLLADVGLVGLPNVGKSSILSIISEAKPKIANYHFTTIEPNLGVVKVGEGESFVIADIPGLIEGASEGVGLGFDFLKHIERTKVLVHVLDASGSEGRNPVEDYNTIRKEMLSYNIKIADKKEIIVANKMDIEGAKEGLEKIKKAFPDKIDEIIEMSAATTEGIDKLKYKIWEYIKDIKLEYETYDEEYIPFEEEAEPDYEVTVREGNTFIVTGPLIDDLVYRTNFEDYEALRHFQKVLDDKEVFKKLKELNIGNGDLVIVGEMEFEYFD